MGIRIARGTIPFDTEGRKGIFAGVVIQTTDAFSGAFSILCTKRCCSITTTIIGGIADNTGVRHALTRLFGAVPITDARHAFRTVIAIDT